MAAILTFINDFSAGSLPPYWPHVALLTTSVLASLSVGIGIILEQPRYSEAAHRVATCLVIWGVVIEACCTIFLFAFDEGISAAQQSKIIALEARLAARTLSDAQVLAIAERLKPLGIVHFDVVTYWQNPEAVAIANRIFSALVKAGWIYDKPQRTEFILGVQTGVSMLFDKRGLGLEKAADALVEALKGNGIDAATDGVMAPDNEPINTKLTVNVGIKP